MNKLFRVAIMFFMILAIAGCGGGGSPTIIVTQPIVEQISSDKFLDGDIALDRFGTFRVTQDMTLLPIAEQSVFAGIDPDPLSGEEFRAFLHFPLASVRLDAVIVSAFLDITIDSIVILPSANSIPILIELVSFQQPLIDLDFDRVLLLPLATVTFPVFRTNVGNQVRVNVTRLMEEAQFRGLANFQIRISDGGTGFDPPGLIEINNTTGVNRRVLAPLLEVTYF